MISVPLLPNCVSTSSDQHFCFFTSQISFSAFLLFGFSAFQLSSFSAFLLSSFSAFQLFIFSDFRLFYFSASQLFYFSAFLLFSFPLFRLSPFLRFSFLATKKRLWHAPLRSLSHLSFSNQLPIFWSFVYIT